MPKFIFRRGGKGGGPGPAMPPPNVRIGQFYLDTGHRLLHSLNETARQLLREGLPVNRDDLLRQSLFTLTGAPVGPSELPLHRAWRDGVPQEVVFVLKRPGQVPQLLAWSASPLKGGDEQVCGVTGTVVVTTPEPDWHELASLAHDLRTPLQTMRLLVPVLESMPLLHPEALQMLERLRSSCDRALSLGLDLLNWCRNPAQGAPRVQRNWLPLRSFLTTLAAEQTPLAQRKGLNLVVEVSAAEGWEVNTDRGRLGRLLANLLTNALRYTTTGEVRLSASWQEEGGQRCLVLAVSDTGAGIDAEEQESIFQAFERGKAGKESDSTGSGVGLAAVDRLVSDLDLTLDVYSEYGAGSTFELRLPLATLRKASSETVPDTA
jgi:anti-sigma regulatory factor (Ser/Thr protein kinase)